jgi:nucleotide-binding universal stress UspA family protein
MYKKILVPTDGSDLSDEAVAAAIEFARLAGSQIVAFSSVEPYPILPVTESAMVIDPGIDTEARLRIALENVEKVAQAARRAGVACTTATASALPVDLAIIDAATSHGCDLIFMASHGRHGLSKLLVGSVTQDVLAHSTIPVMVLRPQRKGGAPSTAAPPSP